MTGQVIPNLESHFPLKNIKVIANFKMYLVFFMFVYIVKQPGHPAKVELRKLDFCGSCFFLSENFPRITPFLHYSYFELYASCLCVCVCVAYSHLLWVTLTCWFRGQDKPVNRPAYIGIICYVICEITFQPDLPPPSSVFVALRI